MQLLTVLTKANTMEIVMLAVDPVAVCIQERRAGGAKVPKGVQQALCDSRRLYATEPLKTGLSAASYTVVARCADSKER
jgi:hypothetical protein